jgi:hypothetical protein
MSDVTAAGRDVVPLRTAHPIQELELENPSYAVDPSNAATSATRPGWGASRSRFSSGCRATIAPSVRLLGSLPDQSLERGGAVGAFVTDDLDRHGSQPGGDRPKGAPVAEPCLRDYLDVQHHPVVFVGEDVAVDGVLAEEIAESDPDDDLAPRR